MSKSRLLSGRVKKITGSELDLDRSQFLNLANAEPDLGNPDIDGSILVADINGNRYWSPSIRADVTGNIFLGSINSADGSSAIRLTYSTVIEGDLTVADGVGNIPNLITSDIRSIDSSSIVFANSIIAQSNLDVQNDLAVDNNVRVANSVYADKFVGDGSQLTNLPTFLGYTGSQGDIGYTGSQGETGYVGSGGTDGSVGYTGSQGDIGYTGSRGADGQFGGASFYYIFASDQYVDTVADGYFRLDNSDTSLVTFIALANIDRFNTNIDSFIQTIDDSTSDIKGYIKITEEGSPSNFTIFAVTNVHSHHDDHYHIPVSYVSGILSTPLNDTNSVISFTVNGDRGDIGYTGSQGVIGYTGSQGDIGYTGSAGTDGTNGTNGTIGYTGSQGDIGYTGSAGIDGINGTIGVDGYTGSQGDLGYTGSQGDIGLTGYTGSIGLGILSTDIIGNELIITFDDSSQKNLGNVLGYTGSSGTGGTGGGGSLGGVFSSETPPNDAAVNDLWFDTNSLNFYINYDDGDKIQWVQLNTTAGAGNTTSASESYNGKTFVMSMIFGG